MKETPLLTAFANIIKLLWHVSMDQLLNARVQYYNYSRKLLDGQAESQALENNLLSCIHLKEQAHTRYLR